MGAQFAWNGRVHSWLTGFCLLFAVCANAQNGAGGHYHPPVGIPRANQFAGISLSKQAALSYFQNLTNLSQIELNAINTCLVQQFDMGTPRRVPLDEQPENYERMTGEQKAIFDVLFFSSKRVEEFTDSDSKNQDAWKTGIQRPKPIPRDPWRKIDGKPVFVLSQGSGFQGCYGTVIQSFDGGVLVKPLLDVSGDFFIRNFPFQVPDGYVMDGGQIMAKNDGLKTFTTVLGATRTVTQMDYGEPCEKPIDGGKTEAEAFTISEGTKNRVKEIEARIAEDKVAAAAAKKRIADFLQQIEDEKIMAVEKRKQRQDLIKTNAVKSNQDMADRGDAYGLLRMGERYRDGDGVPKDLTKARDYLTKAVAAGSPTAADELSKMNQVLTNSPAMQ